MKYLALTRTGITPATTTGVVRYDPGAGSLQRYDAVTHDWISDPALSRLFTGSLDSEPITEAQALEIVARLDTPSA